MSEQLEDKNRYRLVSDYGYGDKCWLERNLTADEAVKALNDQIRGGGDFETIEQALNYDGGIYSIQHDDWDDVEDWDFMSS